MSIACVAWLAGALLFYRGSVFSGFAHVGGESGDTRLLVFISEHWYRVLQGLATWRDLPMFHPLPGTLGFSDALALFQPFYALFRLVGADPFLAFQATLMALSGCGYAAFVALARRLPGVGWPAAIVGGLLFVFANNLYLAAGNPQLQAVHLVPVPLLAAIVAWQRRLTAPGTARLLALVAGLGSALLLYTAYYVGWFFGLATLLFALSSLATGAVRPWRWERFEWRAAIWLLALFVSGFVVAITPFLLTYLPVLDLGFARSYPEALHYSGTPADLFNVGTRNLAWGWLLDGLQGYSEGRVDNAGLARAVTPGLLVAGFSGVWLLAIGRDAGSSERSRRARLAVALALTLLALLLLPLRFGDLSPWWLVWHLIPGAEAIRAIFRLELLAGAVAALLAVLALQAIGETLCRAAGPRRAWLTVSFIAVLLLAEQVNLADATELDRRAELMFLERAPATPADCSSFVLASLREPGRTGIAQQIDAMLLAQQLGIPTLGGYSGLVPPGWQLLDPREADFVARSSRWAALHELTGVCLLDAERGRWWVLVGP